MTPRGWSVPAPAFSISPQRSGRVASPSATTRNYALPDDGGIACPDLASLLVLPKTDDARRALGARSLTFTCSAASLGIPGCLTLAEWQQHQ
jgi:hypothetical protein